MMIVRDRIPIEKLKTMAQEAFGNLVKAVVDVERKVMAVNGDLHSDEEKLLLEDGSKQENLWGINIYPEAAREQRIEFDSLINIRPWQENRSRGVEDTETRRVIAEIVEQLTAE